MATRFLYLVRHGQYTHIPEGPKRDAGLTELGLEQSQATGEALRAFPIEMIYTSDLWRALQTAQAIAASFPDVPLRRSQTLRETIPYVPPHKWEEYQARRPNVTLEDMKAKQQRTDKTYGRFFNRARGHDKHILIVSHGNLIRYFVCLAWGIPLAQWVDLGSLNCGITMVQIWSDGKSFVQAYNDVGHLTDDQQTDNFFPLI